MITNDELFEVIDAVVNADGYADDADESDRRDALRSALFEPLQKALLEAGCIKAAPGPHDDYAASEVRSLLKRGPHSGEDFFRMKLTGDGETRWVNVTPAQLQKIHDALGGE